MKFLDAFLRYVLYFIVFEHLYSSSHSIKPYISAFVPTPISFAVALVRYLQFNSCSKNFLAYHFMSPSSFSVLGLAFVALQTVVWILLSISSEQHSEDM